MSKLLFKIMANSYYRQYEQNTLFQDCFSALTTSIQTMSQKIDTELKQIKQVLSLPSQPSSNQMSVIIEQETDRSMSQGMSYERWIFKLKDQFNAKIGKIKKIQIKAEKLVNIYKSQLLDISKQMAKWQTKNQQLKKQIKKINQLNDKLAQQNNELKDQITSQSAQFFMKDEQEIQSVFDIKSSKEQTPKFKIKNKQKQKQKEKERKNQTRRNSLRKIDNQIKLNTSTATPKLIEQSQQLIRKQQKQANIIQINIRQAQSNQDLQKWKKLSKKIDELKSKLVLYEQQIEQKDKQIKKLKIQIKQLKAQQVNEQQQKRKIKTVNTTLRGQKTVLQNQLASLKKQYIQKNQLCSIQQSQIQQLKLQIQNFSQTIKWQTTTIDQLRSSYTKTHNKSNQQYEIKITKLQNLNQQLFTIIDRQQQQLQQIQKRTKQIDEKLQLKLNQMTGRIGQLQIILQQKNQCIVRMKTKGIGNQNINPNLQTNNQSMYLNQLVRVLTKKVADRDQVIRKLQNMK